MDFQDIENIQIDNIIKQALLEDIGTGDITTDAIVPPSQYTKGIIKVFEEGVIAGLHLAKLIFKKLDSEIVFQYEVNEGKKVFPGEILAKISGSARAILKGERIALNFLQRMSGIATLTSNFCHEVKDSPVRIVDTRKTTPGLRILEKYAVRIGGALNHRFGLYDAVLIKDNHIAIAGGIKPAIQLAKKNVSHTVKIEIEVENLSQLKEALEENVDIVMLDNMNLATMRKAVEISQGKTLLEASGGITLKTVKNV
ncbi:MAG: carboxylating nicotinate-nucleotide diphosphorylase, partial [Candidatus Atribacteria bacterium]|nr:carboxylating nicotinate-nucleotide diphosphorylase [Candidatus Atribacteria bacterium]